MPSGVPNIYLDTDRSRVCLLAASGGLRDLQYASCSLPNLAGAGGGGGGGGPGVGALARPGRGPRLSCYNVSSWIDVDECWALLADCGSAAGSSASLGSASHFSTCAHCRHCASSDCISVASSALDLHLWPAGSLRRIASNPGTVAALPPPALPPATHPLTDSRSCCNLRKHGDAAHAALPPPSQAHAALPPPSQAHGVAPRSQAHGVAPTSQAHGAAPPSQAHGVAPPSQAHPTWLVGASGRPQGCTSLRGGTDALRPRGGTDGPRDVRDEIKVRNWLQKHTV